MHTILRVEQLTKHFMLHGQGTRVPSCDNVTLDVNAGQLTALTGPTGAGKSSVLKCIYRTYLPSAGRLLYFGADRTEVDLAQLGEHEMLALRGREIGFVTQFMHCLPRKSALDVISAPLVSRGETRNSAHEQAAELLERLNVPERLWRLPPATFSGGEKQRINLARGLIARPRLLLLDEPTASLDPHTTDRVVELLGAMKAEGIAMLAIFHQPDLVDRLADQVVELRRPSPIHNLLENSAL